MRSRPLFGKRGDRTGKLGATFFPRMLRWYLWMHILAGWTITPLLFAGLAGLLRND